MSNLLDQTNQADGSTLERLRAIQELAKENIEKAEQAEEVEAAEAAQAAELAQSVEAVSDSPEPEAFERLLPASDAEKFSETFKDVGDIVAHSEVDMRLN